MRTRHPVSLGHRHDSAGLKHLDDDVGVAVPAEARKIGRLRDHLVSRVAVERIVGHRVTPVRGDDGRADGQFRAFATHHATE